MVSKQLIVGVDGSAGSAHALRWALEEANRQGASLVAVLAYTYLDQRHVEGDAFDATYDAADALVALEHHIKEAVGDADVTARVVCDLPADALVDAGRDADLVVVGARGLGGFKGLLLGSVSERVLERSTSPVAVVHGTSAHPHRGAVAVGVDGTAASDAALTWAADAARARGARLHVVHAWREALPAGLTDPSSDGDPASAVIDRVLATPEVAGLDVQTHVVEGSAAGAILEVAARCSLVVVGRRGRSRLAGTLFGSTSRQVVHHARCPVVVVPADA